MKRFSMVAVCLCLMMSIPSMAQSLLDNTLTSDGGLTIQYPAGYLGQADEDFAVGLLNLDLGIFMIIGVDEASYSFTGEEATTSDELKEGFLSAIRLLGGEVNDETVQDLVINDRPAFLVSFDTTSIGIGYFLSFELADGSPASGLIIGTTDTAIPAEIVEDLKAIAASATLDRSLATTEDTTNPNEITSSITPEAADDIEDVTEVEDIPEGAIVIADLPEGMILTGTGLQMITLDGFSFMPGTDYIENSVGLISSTFQDSVVLLDMGEMTDDDRALYINSVLPTVALMGGNENFDVETDLQVMEIDERTITYYASPDFTDEDDQLSLYYFIIDLLPDTNRIVTVQVMFVESAINALDEDRLMEFIQSIKLTDEAIAEMNAPHPVECGDIGSSVTGANDATTLVTCPAGCDATSGSIWGTEIYTDDSSICLATIHMGLLDETGGEVVVSYVKGQDGYTSTELNGIASSEYGSWGASFSVSAPEETE